MPLAPIVIASIIGSGAAVAGGALANRSKQVSTPTLDPKYAGVQQTVLDLITKRLTDTPADMTGYTANGISDINRTFALSKQASDNNLSARGLSTSPVAATVDSTRGMAQAGAIARFKNSIPLLQRDLQTQDLSGANSILAQGRGITTTGSYGGGAAGAFENLAAYIGYLQGKGMFGAPGGNGIPGQMPMPGAFGTSGAY